MAALEYNPLQGKSQLKKDKINDASPILIAKYFGRVTHIPAQYAHIEAAYICKFEIWGMPSTQAISTLFSSVVVEVLFMCSNNLKK